MFNWMTTDGYFAEPDGNLEWVVPDEEQAKAAAEGIPGFDTVLFGRQYTEVVAADRQRAVEARAPRVTMTLGKTIPPGYSMTCERRGTFGRQSH
jgi:hypothetical protein